MKFTLLIYLVFLPLILCGQEIKTISMEFDGGKLTFQYYEKDGVKIPHGEMKYENERYGYTEIGQNVNGYKEGKWTATNKLGKQVFIDIYNYKKGLLNDTITLHKIERIKKGEYAYVPRNYYFKNGHLFGENKIVNSSGDTLYCNFDENGNRIGIWKFDQQVFSEVGEYKTSGSNEVEAFRIDKLGQKEPLIDSSSFNMSSSLPLIMFDEYFKYYPHSVRIKRPNLPSLCKVEYGLYKSFEEIPND